MYALDTEAAKQADQKGGSINETGKYTGIFTRAENVKSPKGTIGVEFSFRSDDGRAADYLTLWTENKDGKALYGYKTLMAIMACLKVRNITPISQKIEKYDHGAGGKVTVDAEVFPDLMNKPIGLLIQMEEYEKQDHSTNWKPVIYAPFEASTGFTASEILSKAVKPETLEKMEASLKDRPLRARSGSAAPVSSAPAPTGGYDDFDDSIPF